MSMSISTRTSVQHFRTRPFAWADSRTVTQLVGLAAPRVAVRRRH
jgi:hypothetical protein